jgi:cytochrome b561
MIASDTTQTRYTSTAIVLHWTIAILILFNLSLGFFMEGFTPPWKGVVIPLHISSGITVLVLTAGRLIWRLAHRPPPFPSDMKTWECKLAHLVHVVVYVLMFAVPITGWSIISAHPPRPGAGPVIWGLIRIPTIGPISNMGPTTQKAAHDSFVQAHSIGGWIFVALLLLHIVGALKHQIIDRHAELARMGIGRISAS